jgi:hypothetical protein
MNQNLEDSSISSLNSEAAMLVIEPPSLVKLEILLTAIIVILAILSILIVLLTIM